MPQPGGSATMYGVLYQLLGAAHWAGKIQLSTSIDDGEWMEARLVIEPLGGGGDTRIESPRRRITTSEDSFLQVVVGEREHSHGFVE